MNRSARNTTEKEVLGLKSKPGRKRKDYSRGAFQ